MRQTFNFGRIQKALNHAFPSNLCPSISDQNTNYARAYVPGDEDGLHVAVLLWLDLALLLWLVLDEGALLVGADLVALERLAVVGNADLAGDLAAGGLGGDLVHDALLQGALLDGPVLASLVKLEESKIAKA